MKKYVNAILNLASIGILLYILFDQKQQIAELKSARPNVDSLQQVIDSVSNEAFINHTNAERYEIALDKLMEDNPKAAEEFEECLKNTE